MISRNNLEIKLERNSYNKTVVTHQYTNHPLRLSNVFRLDATDMGTAYLYLTSTSPGLLAGDNLNLSLDLEKGASLYFTDQAAIKVHAMPITATKATTNTKIKVKAGARLEFVAEPLILFADAALEQTTQIQLDSNAELFWSEIMIPGRLARGEWYKFRYYFSQLKMISMTEEICFKDAIHLEGKDNLFKDSDIFASMPILANLIVIQPNINRELLSQKLENIEAANCSEILLGSSVLPNNKGLLIRVLASKTIQIKQYIKYALNCVRNLTNRSSLPYIPK
ncbi:urease accessory protein UreD [Okeania sp.]|uniref:urease accessory protein UreD n=1 Tax=Okeania sp. TaxID=3100323 RepID=UPI002B4B938A|nr:urease accessory protein UreD [Okeania sp.]MEB3339901.1 urease accessory protein UreD [Okeania sp.]